MGTIADVKTLISANINTNGNNEITATKVRAVLNAIVDKLDGKQYAGVAHSLVTPIESDTVFYIAFNEYDTEKTLSNFGVDLYPRTLSILTYNAEDEEWVDTTILVMPTSGLLAAVEQDLPRFLFKFNATDVSALFASTATTSTTVVLERETEDPILDVLQECAFYIEDTYGNRMPVQAQWYNNKVLFYYIDPSCIMNNTTYSIKYVYCSYNANTTTFTFVSKGTYSR